MNPRDDASRFSTDDAGGCPHEAAVVAAVLRGRGAERAADAFHQHLESCAACREAAALAQLFAADCGERRDDVRVPAAGQVWWRCAVRARLEAMQAAARPMSWIQAVSAALVALGLAGAAAMAFAPASAVVAGVARRAPRFEQLVDAWPSMNGAVSGPVPLVALALAACVVAASVAVYAALHDEWRKPRSGSDRPRV